MKVTGDTGSSSQSWCPKISFSRHLAYRIRPSTDHEEQRWLCKPESRHRCIHDFLHSLSHTRITASAHYSGHRYSPAAVDDSQSLSRPSAHLRRTDMVPEAICQIRCGMVLRIRRESRSLFYSAGHAITGSRTPVSVSRQPYSHPCTVPLSISHIRHMPVTRYMPPLARPKPPTIYSLLSSCCTWAKLQPHTELRVAAPHLSPP